MRQHLTSLDSLRGIAALLVVCYHLPAWYPPIHGFAWLRNGGLMVNFFFVLSGFVLYYSYANRLRTRVDFTKFITLRMGRLYPVHLLFLLFFLGAEAIKYAATAHGLSGSNHAAFRENSVGAFFESLFLVQALGFTPHSAVFNFPAWSISTEFYTYLIFALGLVALPKRGFLLFSTALLTTALGLLLFAHAQLGEFHWWLRCLSGFFTGCLSAELFQLFGRRRASGAFAGFVLLLLFVFLSLDLRGYRGEWILPLSALVVVTLALAPDSLVNRVLLWRPLRWLGEVSYSLYMSHAAVLWLARQACRVVLKAPEALDHGALTAQLEPPLGFVVSVAAVVGAVLLAGLTHRLVEVPFRARTRQLVAAWQ
jgi:peptidoglycan/LPS O-acetylase OafA/YrhL